MALTKETELSLVVAAVFLVVAAARAIVAGDFACIGFTDFAIAAADVVTTDIGTAIVNAKAGLAEFARITAVHVIHGVVWASRLIGVTGIDTS